MSAAKDAADRLTLALNSTAFAAALNVAGGAAFAGVSLDVAATVGRAGGREGSGGPTLVAIAGAA